VIRHLTGELHRALLRERLEGLADALVQLHPPPLHHRAVDRVAQVDLRERHCLAVVRLVDQAVPRQLGHRGVRLFRRHIGDPREQIDLDRFADDGRRLEQRALLLRERVDFLHQDRRHAAGDAQRADAIHVRRPAGGTPLQVVVGDEVIDDAPDVDRRSRRLPQHPPHEFLGDVLVAEKRLHVLAHQRLGERLDPDQREVAVFGALLPEREAR
jgi:hypothetical protein